MNIVLMTDRQSVALCEAVIAAGQATAVQTPELFRRFRLAEDLCEALSTAGWLDEPESDSAVIAAACRIVRALRGVDEGTRHLAFGATDALRRALDVHIAHLNMMMNVNAARAAAHHRPVNRTGAPRPHAVRA